MPGVSSPPGLTGCAEFIALHFVSVGSFHVLTYKIIKRVVNTTVTLSLPTERDYYWRLVCLARARQRAWQSRWISCLFDIRMGKRSGST